MTCVRRRASVGHRNSQARCKRSVAPATSALSWSGGTRTWPKAAGGDRLDLAVSVNFPKSRKAARGRSGLRTRRTAYRRGSELTQSAMSGRTRTLARLPVTGHSTNETPIHTSESPAISRDAGGGRPSADSAQRRRAVSPPFAWIGSRGLLLFAFAVARPTPLPVGRGEVVWAIHTLRFRAQTNRL
jgi:hypothetical protein